MRLMIRSLLIAATCAATALPGASVFGQSGGQAGAQTGTLAGGQACETYAVTARLLNVRSEPSVFGRILDVLAEDQIACVSEIKNTSGQQWGNVVHKSDPGAATEPVNGWASMRFLTPVTLSGSGSASDQGAPAVGPDQGPSQGPENPPQPENPALPANPALLATGDTDEFMLTFTAPVPYGAFPVRGRSLQTLAQGLPLFAPFEGLPEDRWRVQCANCHQWNADRLCEQGKGYAANPAMTLRIQHPYGGPYKKTLGDWAKAGCK